MDWLVCAERFRPYLLLSLSASSSNPTQHSQSSPLCSLAACSSSRKGREAGVHVCLPAFEHAPVTLGRKRTTRKPLVPQHTLPLLPPLSTVHPLPFNQPLTALSVCQMSTPAQQKPSGLQALLSHPLVQQGTHRSTRLPPLLCTPLLTSLCLNPWSSSLVAQQQANVRLAGLDKEVRCNLSFDPPARLSSDSSLAASQNLAIPSSPLLLVLLRSLLRIAGSVIWPLSLLFG